MSDHRGTKHPLRVVILGETAAAAAIEAEIRRSALDLTFERVDSELDLHLALGEPVDLVVAADDPRRDICEVMRRSFQPACPFIVVTDQHDPMLLFDALSRGAADLVARERPRALLAAAERQLRVQSPVIAEDREDHRAMFAVRDGMIVSLNEAALALTRCERADQLPGRPISEFIPSLRALISPGLDPRHIWEDDIPTPAQFRTVHGDLIEIEILSVTSALAPSSMCAIAIRTRGAGSRSMVAPPRLRRDDSRSPTPEPSR